MPIAESDLKVGDRVVYANQGVCRVVGTATMEIAGTKQEFIKLAREDAEATVISVPKGRLDKAGIRRVADASELKKVFTYLAAPVEGPELDWKVRARSHGERMSEGGLMGLAQVVKSLTTLADLRPLPPKERELYDNARHLLVSEVSAASGLPEGSAEDAVDLAMFPPGKERVKPTLAMAMGGEEGDELGLDEGLEATGLEEAALEEEPAEAEEAQGEEGEEEQAQRKPRAPKKPAAAKGGEKPAKAPKEPKPKADKPAKPAKAAKPKAEPKPKAEKPAKAPKATKPKAEPKAKAAAKAKPKKK